MADNLIDPIEMADRAAIAAEWGVPADSLFIESARASDMTTYEDYDPAKWAEWWWEALLSPPDDNTYPPRVTRGNHASGAVTEHPAYRARAWKDGLDPYIEKRFHPNGGFTLRVGNLLPSTTAKTIASVWAGREILAQHPKGPGGRKEIPLKTARRRLIAAADQADSDGYGLDVYTLSTATSRGARTISYWLERADWGIEDLRIALQRFKARRLARTSS